MEEILDDDDNEEANEHKSEGNSETNSLNSDYSETDDDELSSTSDNNLPECIKVHPVAQYSFPRPSPFRFLPPSDLTKKHLRASGQLEQLALLEDLSALCKGEILTGILPSTVGHEKACGFEPSSLLERKCACCPSCQVIIKEHPSPPICSTCHRELYLLVLPSRPKIRKNRSLHKTDSHSSGCFDKLSEEEYSEELRKEAEEAKKRFECGRQYAVIGSRGKQSTFDKRLTQRIEDDDFSDKKGRSMIESEIGGRRTSMKEENEEDDEEEDDELTRKAMELMIKEAEERIRSEGIGSDEPSDEELSGEENKENEEEETNETKEDEEDIDTIRDPSKIPQSQTRSILGLRSIPMPSETMHMSTHSELSLSRRILKAQLEEQAAIREAKKKEAEDAKIQRWMSGGLKVPSRKANEGKDKAKTQKRGKERNSKRKEQKTPKLSEENEQTEVQPQSGEEIENLEKGSEDNKENKRQKTIKTTKHKKIRKPKSSKLNCSKKTDK
ncbi:uncharacterized protein MONOS_15935 [Monocercomonoides exilis]|uniref:uncharacterized protein n=1 Tax=Monocercomonoides exilis TaxID=2049356 RepID=UPI003559B66F|nr:hypothetical protein MONOS_15935 [Monocercomonoides exilis]|eukprot:MONOS_15935.1-p1 / transcript=MONOS_15935.1 / gene=MONOS_15935 / organism=Monocercomonoides_exilis_PA203 / gene_product=unspecified product / transcript_product=unspecified product / location=Mono_scaffold01417:1582-3203(-) / protein_length=499 / sequence_SO=supercontig / SO=protein_coding / is_pseudo=false